MGFGGSGEMQGEGRAGALTLSLLATPLHPEILGELSGGPRRLSELRRQAGSPPQAVLRARLEQLGELGVVARRRVNLFPSVHEYELTSPAGKELLFVLTSLEGWLASAPEEPVHFSSCDGQAAAKALAESWSSTTLRALLAGVASPADRDRLEPLREAGLIARRDRAADGSSYEVTAWLRKGTGPIAAAIRWERNHLPDSTVPIRPIDAEAGLLLAMPLLRPPPELSGSCRLGVEFGEGEERRLAGVTVEVAGGRVTSCTTRLESSPTAWASGPPEAWLRTTIEADPGRLELGGELRLVRGLLDGLNQVLFGPVRPLPPGS
jgi:DNA-binding HxlR family transcriptional regulator